MKLVAGRSGCPAPSMNLTPEHGHLHKQLCPNRQEVSLIPPTRSPPRRERVATAEAVVRPYLPDLTVWQSLPTQDRTGATATEPVHYRRHDVGVVMDDFVDGVGDNPLNGPLRPGRVVVDAAPGPASLVQGVEVSAKRSP